MPTLRSAFLCALSALILFSCNLKSKSKIVEQHPVANVAMEQPLAGETVNITSLRKKFLDASTQHFSVSSKKVSLLKAKGGLKVKINPAVLEKENGAVLEGNIEVSIIELMNVNDLFKGNVATVCNGKLLVSGGSYFIGMENGGEKVRIRNGRTLQTEFPMINKEDMELFYGERNEADDMNWEKTNVSFRKQYESVSFTDQSRWDNRPTAKLEEFIEPKIYKSLDEVVYYYKNKMTLDKLVDTLNKKSTKFYLQTISYWPKNLPTDRIIDTNYLVSLYGPRKQYILKSCKEEEERKEAMEKWQPKTLAAQLQKYYEPTAITSLGWINCDRFYDPGKQAETKLEMPYTFNNSIIEYFILFKSFNGLINGRTLFDDNQKPALSSLPVGEEITLVAFTKKNGIIYQAKEDFIVGKSKSLPLDFKEITIEEMKKMFGANVKI